MPTPACHHGAKVTRRRAYYSKRQSEFTGIYLYRLADGREVNCTEVALTPSPWPDMVDLGELATEDCMDSLVRQVRRGWVEGVLGLVKIK